MKIDFYEMRGEPFYKRIPEEKKRNVERVTENGGWEDIDTCPVCHSDEYTLHFTDKINNINFKSYICSECDCLFNDKIPKNQNIGEYNISLEELHNSIDQKKYQYKKNTFAKEKMEILRLYAPRILSECRLLDVGCNTGYFLDHIKEEMLYVEGLEKTETIASDTERRLSIPIHTSDFISFSNGDNYDIITLFDVMEHVKKPLEFLKKGRNLLSSPGILFGHVPNHRSFAYNLLGTRASFHFPSDHLQVFSARTIHYMAEVLDLDVLLCETIGMDFFDLLCYERDIKNNNINDLFMLENANKIQNIIDKLGYSNCLRFVLR